MEDNFSLSKGQIALWVIGIILLALVVTWIFWGNRFFLYKVSAPQEEQVRRETFEQSKAYRQGMIQELQNMQIEYQKANEVHKAALADVILYRAADFPEEDMPLGLRSFVQRLKIDRANAR